MNMLKGEWKKVLNNRMLILMMIAIPFIPIIYAGIILSAYWDPFGSTSNLPVAVVNLDEPSEMEGKTLAIGDELVNYLKENDSLKWYFVSQEEAQAGFEDGDYYMVITIPKDFSKSASTVMEDHPEKMSLSYEVNPGRNFFSVTISEQAMNRINQEISKTVTEEYTRVIFSQISDMGEGFAEAADGAVQINDGVEQLQAGNREITENLSKLASSILTFKNGVDTIQVGVGSFIEGANELYSGASQLNEGITQYTDGIEQLHEKSVVLIDEENGVPKLAQGQQTLNSALNELATGSQNLTNGLNQLNQQLPSQSEITQLTEGLSSIQQAINQLQQAASQSGASPELIAQINTLTAVVNQVQPKAIGAIGGYQTISQVLAGDNGMIQGSEKLAAGMNQAVSGSDVLTSATANLNNQLPQLVGAIDQLDSKSSDLKDGSAQLVQGIDTLSSKLPVLKNGVSQLADGATQLHDGASKLTEGSSELGEGILTLHDGTGELAEKLAEGADTVESIQTTDENYDMLVSPVTLKEAKTNEVPNYGHALAPMFISLGLYIGALAFNMIFPLRETTTSPTSGLAWWISKFSLGVVPAVAGALILDTIVRYGMGLEVQNIGQFVLISVLASLTYMFFLMLLVILLGNPGRFIAMILLVLQLGSSGGMFPIALQNDFFHAINPYMPMTYVIYGLREAMTGSLGNDLFIRSVLMLVGCIVIFNALLFLFLHVKNKRGQQIATEN
ncbi:YhgE/Pip domain-containing protein [Bacillus sp. PS06]|uniref:YhgE/Pip domain-containing protein n=1 Tax=Bacillus sp. PS06 TaxID=2764176 RepID=UPI00177DB9BE|nr:YhgE/Pip domain-containing protein [Bacillus sp. PS06]MBD8070048.1 YhgE/Pip domain-containing protein [Bacillus sp. PS06]